VRQPPFVVRHRLRVNRVNTSYALYFSPAAAAAATTTTTTTTIILLLLLVLLLLYYDYDYYYFFFYYHYYYYQYYYYYHYGLALSYLLGGSRGGRRAERCHVRQPPFVVRHRLGHRRARRGSGRRGDTRLQEQEQEYSEKSSFRVFAMAHIYIYI